MALVQTPVHIIGGSGGNSFTYDQSRNGRVLTKIGVWAGEWQLRGIRIWMSGSDSPATFGTASGSYDEYTFADGERITRLSLWGNGAGKHPMLRSWYWGSSKGRGHCHKGSSNRDGNGGTRSGGIRFYTTTGRSFFHKMTSWGLKTEYPIDVASGLCVGIMGRANVDIDSLGFLFLRTIRSSRMINVSYPTLGLEQAGIILVTLDSYNDSNNAGTISKNWNFSGSRTVTISSSWTLTSGVEAHATVSVQAGIPLVAEVTGEFGWSVSVTGSHTSTQEESRTLSWNQSGTLEPGQWISLQATTRRGTITLPYQGTMEITLQSGTVFQYPISSMYSGVDYTSVDITNTGTKAFDQVEVADTDQQAQEGDQKAQSNKEIQECKLLFTE